MKSLTEIITAIKEQRKDLEFLPTGFITLDNDLDGGFMRKELVVIGGSTGIGKSYLSGQLLWNIASRGYKSAYFSLEIANEMIISRLLGQLANVKSTLIMKGAYDEAEKKRLNEATLKIKAYESLMDFYDNLYHFKEIYQAIKERSYEFVVIDFIQNVVIPGMDEYARLSHISLELQRLAKEVNCCIVALSQLSNAFVKDRSSTTIEYKGSGAIAMVADLGFFLERDYTLNTLTLCLRKNRRGISGTAYQFLFEVPGGKLYE